MQTALKKAEDILQQAVTDSKLQEKTDLGETEKLILLRLELVKMALSSHQCQCPVRILSSSSSLARLVSAKLLALAHIYMHI